MLNSQLKNKECSKSVFHTLAFRPFLGCFYPAVRVNQQSLTGTKTAAVIFSPKYSLLCFYLITSYFAQTNTVQVHFLKVFKVSQFKISWKPGLNLISNQDIFFHCMSPLSDRYKRWWDLFVVILLVVSFADKHWFWKQLIMKKLIMTHLRYFSEAKRDYPMLRFYTPPNEILKKGRHQLSGLPILALFLLGTQDNVFH